jgi:hypothetical protein
MALGRLPLTGEVPRPAAAEEAVEQRLHDLDHDPCDRGEQLPAFPLIDGRPIAAVTATFSRPSQSGSPPLRSGGPRMGHEGTTGNPRDVRPGRPVSADHGAADTGPEEGLEEAYRR